MPNSDDFRVKRIKQMLLEMAQGNFYHSLDPSDKNDNVATLIVMLNMVNEEIRASFIHQGFVGSKHTPQHLVQMAFIIDTMGMIEMVNQNTCSTLSAFHTELVGSPFVNTLTEESQRKWLKKQKSITNRECSDSTMDLVFKTSEGLLISKNCNISTFGGKTESPNKILLSTILFTKGESFAKGIWGNALRPGKESKVPRVKLSHEDIRKIREVHDLIITNLDHQLPHLKDLAHQMGTNEFKLKYGFKQLYGTTVFKFLIQERLRKAKTLIQFSSLSLKTIAHMVGFKSIPHFSRAFKEKYGNTPSSLRK
ncbi:helix-turn-helix domain-containing protein [Flagellimonas algicola]|uniref:Helix-turn-helix transcriptional regulator n=1 Tax=Flagellimonas algicola TaxID=2583815 RepID=A0ABY2WGS3_9FLAO|nr:AraC family transcriptional regulator [Allomuricauda algicola]TMU50751.1 helix-turn-helix transcriptional regulator [Allomuricauda algicola]